MKETVNQLIVAAGSGDEVAAQKIWDEYYQRLILYARSRLNAMPRRAIDEEDVALSAMNSFFNGVRKGKFDPQDRDELWKLLATITVRKALAQLRKHYAEKRGGGNVRGESVFVAAGESNTPPGIDWIMDDTNLNEMSSNLLGDCEELISNLPDEILRKIALLKLEGYSNHEIAASLEVSLATIKRKLNRIRQEWESDRSDF